MAGFNDFMTKAGALASKAAGKAKDLAGTAAAKTKQLSRIAKLNMDISAQKDDMKKAYAELGKLYYEAHHDAPDETCAPLCAQIDAAAAAIASLEEEIAQIRETMDAEPMDADLEEVVDATETEAGVEVEIEVEEPAAPAEPEAPVEPETPAEPEAPAAPETPEGAKDDPPSWY